MARTARLTLAIGLPLRNQDVLGRLVREVSDPASPNYRSWLTSGQFTARFGPTESDYAVVMAFAESHGLSVSGTHPNRMILDVSGTVASIENAFQIDLVAWNDDVRGSFYAPDREPSLDLDIPILDITGLDNYVVPRPMSIKANSVTARSSSSATGSGPEGLLIGNDFRSAYAPGTKLTGAGQTIGLFELDGFYPGDVAANFKAAGLPAVPVRTVLLDGSNGAPGSGNIEVMLDIMMAGYMAPAASGIVVYEGYNWNDIFNRMATDNAASQLSCSWGFSPITATTEQIFRQMIVQGQSLFQASGDGGAYTGAIMPPSDDPNVTVVGGTHLATTGPGGQWLSEVVWPGSGGGVSKSYAIPSYQQGVNMAAAGGSSTMRNIPDVAMVADIEIYLIQDNGRAVEVGGTSAAAPLWAGFLALVNQQAAASGMGPVGFANPALYSLAGGSNITDLHDIVIGSNNGFSAEPGFDLATGWGTPSGSALIDALAGTKNTASFGISVNPTRFSLVPGGTASGAVSVLAQNGFSGSVALSLSGLPAGVTGSFSAGTLTLVASGSAASGTTSVTVTGKSASLISKFTIAVTVTPLSGFTLAASPDAMGIAQGSSAKTIVTVALMGGSTGPVALTTSGLPAGVTASITHGLVAGTSSLMLNASGLAAVGTTSVAVTGTSGSTTKTALVSLTITAASTFSLTAAPAALTVLQGATASTVITATPRNGFTGTVSLNVSGLPAGVTGSFTQNTLNIAANSTALPGVITITITGSSGNLAQTTTISLAIMPIPSYTLSAAPAALNVAQGNTATAVVTIAPAGGFNGKVSLAASGLPTGVTASFGPVSASNSSTITLSATASASLGTAAMKTTGTSGVLAASATVSLMVLPPANFSLSAAPGSLSVLQGTSGAAMLQMTPINGFSGTVTYTASGLPSGVTASFSSGLLTLAASKTAAKVTAPVTITGTCGSLSHTAVLSLMVMAEPSGDVAVDLSSVFNITGLAADGVPFSGGGLDTGGRSYSGILAGASQTIGGVPFAIAPMNVPDAVSSVSVPLSAGVFTALKMLASGINGTQLSQSFTVTYTDGTKSTFVQSLSDWFSPQSYAGETNAMVFPYRDNSSGTVDGRPFLLYEYSFPLIAGKSVSSLTLPNNRNVIVLSVTLTGGSLSQASH